MSGGDTFAPVTLNNGVKVPGIGYGLGTAWFKADGDPLRDAIVTALKAGYVHLDAAECYGNSKSLGAALELSGVDRSSIFITTKIGEGLNDIEGNFATLLKEMKTDYVDLFLIHWPYEFPKPGYPTLEDAWKQVEKLQEKGLAKAIGVSNYRIQDLERTLKVATIKPAVNQIEFHPYVYDRALDILEFAKKEGIQLAAYGPTVPVVKAAGGPLDPVLAKVAAAVAKRSGVEKVEESQILLKLCSQLGVIPITTSNKDWRMKEQLATGALAALTDAEVDELVAVGKTQHKRIFMHHMDDDKTVY